MCACASVVMISLLNISAQHNVSPFADIIIVNASRSEVKEGALAPSNHSLHLRGSRAAPFILLSFTF